MTYDAAYYEAIREGAQDSAEVVVPLIADAVQPRKVIDVGCGEGWWSKAFLDAGAEWVYSVDGWPLHFGDWTGDYEGRTAQGTVDLEQSFLFYGDAPKFGGPWDLAVCLEVAEHLSPERAEGFVSDLCALAPVVLFSAAIPDQGGEGHQNERWPAYWAELFEARGFAFSMAPRWEVWEDDRVDSWYRQNLAIAAKDPGAFPQWFDTPLARPQPVIHPAFFADLMGFIHNMHALGKIEWR